MVIISNASYELYQGQTLSEDDTSGLLCNATDPQDSGLSVTETDVLDGPMHGTLSLTDSAGAFTYTPDLSFAGRDWFTYAITNGYGLKAYATAFIDVEPVQVGLTAHRTGLKYGDVVSEAVKRGGNSADYLLMVDDADHLASDTVDTLGDDTNLAQIELTLPPADLHEGTLSVEFSDGSTSESDSTASSTLPVRVFDADGHLLSASDLTMDLAHPGGFLAGTSSINSNGNLSLWLQGVNPCQNLKISIVCYNLDGKEVARDDVHMLIAQCDFIGTDNQVLQETGLVDEADLLALVAAPTSRSPIPDSAKYRLRVQGLSQGAASITVTSDTTPVDFRVEQLTTDPADANALVSPLNVMYSSILAPYILTPDQQDTIYADLGVEAVHNAKADVTVKTKHDAVTYQKQAEFYVVVYGNGLQQTEKNAQLVLTLLKQLAPGLSLNYVDCLDGTCHVVLTDDDQTVAKKEDKASADPKVLKQLIDVETAWYSGVHGVRTNTTEKFSAGLAKDIDAIKGNRGHAFGYSMVLDALERHAEIWPGNYSTGVGALQGTRLEGGIIYLDIKERSMGINHQNLALVLGHEMCHLRYTQGTEEDPKNGGTLGGEGLASSFENMLHFELRKLCRWKCKGGSSMLEAHYKGKAPEPLLIVSTKDRRLN